MATVRSYIASQLGTHLSNTIKYLVERGRSLADITANLREKGYHNALGTINEIANYWKDSLRAGINIGGAAFGKAISTFNIPTARSTPVLVRVSYEVNTVLQDGSEKIFGGLTVDIPIGSTVGEAYEAAAEHFRNSLQSLYQIAAMSFVIVQAYSP